MRLLAVPERDPLARGDLLGGQAAPVGEHERLALRHRQLLQGGAHRPRGRRRAPAPRPGRRRAASRPASPLTTSFEAVGRAAARLALTEKIDGPGSRHHPQERPEVPARRRRTPAGAATAAGRRPARRRTRGRGRRGRGGRRGRPSGGARRRRGRSPGDRRGSWSPSRGCHRTLHRLCKVCKPGPGTPHCRAVANPDRLSPLDASFLALEGAGPHMHVGSVLIFEGEPQPYAEVAAHLERRLHLVPRYRQRLAVPAARAGPPGLGRRPALQPRLPPAPHRAPVPGRHGRAAPARRPAVLPAPGPLQAAVGDVARRPCRLRRRRPPPRGDQQDPPRARGRRLGGRHRLRAVRPRSRAAADTAGAAALVPAAAAQRRLPAGRRDQRARCSGRWAQCAARPAPPPLPARRSPARAAR